MQTWAASGLADQRETDRERADELNECGDDPACPHEVYQDFSTDRGCDTGCLLSFLGNVAKNGAMILGTLALQEIPILDAAADAAVVAEIGAEAEEAGTAVADVTEALAENLEALTPEATSEGAAAATAEENAAASAEEAAATEESAAESSPPATDNAAAAADDAASSGFFRGASSGELPDFTLKPGEYRLTGAGQVRGLSVFNNRAAIERLGLDPYEIDQSSLSDLLSIEQRGINPEHFEIVPASGAFPPQDEFQALLDQLQVLEGGG
jgi:hypothetical protein